MPRSDERVAVTIDNRLLQVDKGQTILKAAQQNEIYIPTLCAHPDLTPFGGCRLCIVEVEGMRNFPTACTTPIEAGMVIRTQTAQVQAIRKEILQLILSEHPASCLVCEEKEECKQFVGTIRKAGVTTGCRYCPNDGQCELQAVVDNLGINQIDYPIYYRGLPVEKNDPFYDRDYNLCILCGRCIRMCQEIRAANTLAFKQRGSRTLIGPAYGRTHLEAGCEFCGACVSVCPTGALSEKVRKWQGKPEREEITTCPLCGIGCQVRLLIKEGEVIGTLPAEDPLINNGHLCVKGRFCVPELVNNHLRLRTPYQIESGTKFELSWDKAIDLVAERLTACSPEDFGLLVSPNCSSEDLYIAQKFVRVALGSHNVDTSARIFYGTSFNAYLNLMKRSVPFDRVRQASVILCLGLDTRFERSVVGVELRQAVSRGARIISFNPQDHNLALLADKWIQPKPDQELSYLRYLVMLTEGKQARASHLGSDDASQDLIDELLPVAQMLKEAGKPLILVGSGLFRFNQAPDILQETGRLAENIGAGVLPLPAQNNLFGSILMGAYPELLPGGFSSADPERLEGLGKRWSTDLPTYSPGWDAEALLQKRRMKVLYLVGEIPTSSRPACDFLIFQNIYPPEPLFEANLVLPAAAFTETDGTFINGEGRIQCIKKATDPPGLVLTDWEILCRIARKMGKTGFEFSNPKDIREEISSLIGGLDKFDDSRRQIIPLICEAELTPLQTESTKMKKLDREFPFLLNTFVIENAYRGYPLTRWVEGSRKLFAEGIVEMSPEDAENLKISDGDQVLVTSAHFQRTWPTKIAGQQVRGRLTAILPYAEPLGTNPHAVAIRKKDV